MTSVSLFPSAKHGSSPSNHSAEQQRHPSASLLRSGRETTARAGRACRDRRWGFRSSPAIPDTSSTTRVTKREAGREEVADAKGGTGAAAGGGIYGLGIFGALFYYWQQADAFWEYVWAIFPKAILWPAFLVYEGFSALGA